MKKLYSVNPQERIILDKAKEGDIDLFMDFYFRSPTSGTWWLPGTKTEHWSTGYNRLLREWERSGKPEDKFTSESNEVTYRVTMQHEMSKQYPGLPAFHHNHGILMLDWQKELHNDRHPFRTIAGGFGTSDLDTRVFDAEMGEYVTFRSLIEENRAPVVLSKTDTGWAKTKASVPYYEGTDDMYRVTMQSGRSMCVAPMHRFLTQEGFVHMRDLSVGDQLIVPDKLPAKWHDDAAYVPSDSQTTEDFQSDYPEYHHLCGEPLLLDSMVAQGALPLQGDALPSSHLISQDDLMGLERSDIYYHSRHEKYSNRLLVRHAELNTPLRWRVTNDALAHPEQATQALTQYANTTSPYWQDVLSHDYIDLKPKMAFSVLNDQVEWSYDPASLHNLSQSGKFPVPSQPQTAFHTYPQAPEVFLQSASQTYPLDTPRGDYTTLDIVQSIEYLGQRDHYDIHVPVYNNYVAEGLISHNSGKTLAVVLSFLIHAATLPGYRGLALAPFSKQAKEVYILALSAIRNTKYEERFLRGTPASPFPTLIVGNDYTNTENTIECYGIGDKDDADKLRTLTADNALIDQAEKIMDLQSVIRDVGTRFRGRELTSGRSRIGTMTFLANSGINDELWNLYDKAEENPDKYFSFSPSTYDNIYLTDADIERYELQVGEGEDNKRMYMYGGRPLGDGSEFSRVIMDRVRDPSLDELHEHLTRLGQPTTWIETPGSGVTEWTLPYDPTRFYVVVSDPGTDAPPHRNSPAIMVWDVSKFDIDHPMTLSAYYWFNGRRDISTWANTYATVVSTYHAIGRNGFDATGYQKGYDRWMQTLHNLIPEKFELTATNKPMMLNDAKMLSSRGLIRMPMAVTSIYNQLAFYEYPEPEKLKQDLVMVYIMSAFYAKRLFYMSFQKEETRKFNEWVLEDRNSREMDVYSQRTAR